LTCVKVLPTPILHLKGQARHSDTSSAMCSLGSGRKDALSFTLRCSVLHVTACHLIWLANHFGTTKVSSPDFTCINVGEIFLFPTYHVVQCLENGGISNHMAAISDSCCATGRGDQLRHTTRLPSADLHATLCRVRPAIVRERLRRYYKAYFPA
jgi:hypothetical protein